LTPTTATSSTTAMPTFRPRAHR